MQLHTNEVTDITAENPKWIVGLQKYHTVVHGDGYESCNKLPNQMFKRFGINITHIESGSSWHRNTCNIDEVVPRSTFTNHDDVIKWKHFCVTGLLCGEFTGDRWIPHTKASDAELWCFLSSAHEPTVEQTIETLVIWDATALIMTSLSWWINLNLSID